jgi:ABC-2 type transport system ATP-binding protein
MKGPIIEARDLRCSYGQFEAVRGLDLRIEQGSLYALLGTNGAGKTTTLETLEGHRRPTSGRVRVLGGDPRSAAVRRRTGIMLQESGFAGDLTVAETLRLWAAVAGRSDDRGRLLERVDLTTRRGVRVAQLSGGERRRLDLAMAVYGAPEVVFLDEPTTGLDPQSRARVWDLVRDLLAAGTTVVLTTHYLEEAESLADRIGIMHEGRIAVEGALADVLTAYPSRIGFELPQEVSVAELPAAREAVALQDRQVWLDTDDLQADLYTLLSWARQRGIDLRRLSASEANLADVFHQVAQGATPQVTR